MEKILNAKKLQTLIDAVGLTEPEVADILKNQLQQNKKFAVDDGVRLRTLEEFETASLHNIGAHYCTDKTQTNRTADASYLQIYEIYFERFRRSPVDILEIGVRKGESINTWNKYFTNANSIYGVEIEETWWESLLLNHVHYIHADATEPAILDKLPPEQEFDIIIDDGSHINEQIIKSFEIFYPRLKSGGIYVIEDLYNSYGDRLSSDEIDIVEILGSAKGIEQNKRSDIEPWLRQLEANLNNPYKDIMFIHHWDSIIIIGKV